MNREIDQRIEEEMDKIREEVKEEIGMLEYEARQKGEFFDRSTYKVDMIERLQGRVEYNRKELTLRDMVEWGIRRPYLACDTLLDLWDELKECDQYVLFFVLTSPN